MSESGAVGTVGVLEASARARCANQEVYRLIWERRILANKDSKGHWRIDVASLAKWLELRDRVRQLREMRYEGVEQ